MQTHKKAQIQNRRTHRIHPLKSDDESANAPVIHTGIS